MVRQRCETLDNILLSEFDHFSRNMVEDFEGMMGRFLQEQANFHRQVGIRYVLYGVCVCRESMRILQNLIRKFVLMKKSVCIVESSLLIKENILSNGTFSGKPNSMNVHDLLSG